MVYSDPALWEAAKRAARERLGGHSARAMQLAGQLYRAAGGRYVGRKTQAQQSLTRWTRQDWTTKSGKPSRETGERYLPKRVIEQLSSAEYAATTRAKRKGTKQGKQFVKQPAKIAAKVSRLKAQANPRPRKYASAAEKQAAFRARFPIICVRVEPKTADTIQKIGDASGRTQQETMLSLVKFALTNRDFVNLGLTEHKQLPRMEETRKANPMKRKPTPAQIAARERFAEMARSGAFKKKAKRNPAKKRSSQSNVIMPGDKTVYKRYTIIHPTSGEWFYIVRDGVNIGSARSVAEAKSIIDMLTEGLPNPRKKNPISGQEAGEFRMTVNGKSVTRFFAHDNDPWANSYGFNYRLLSNVVKVGSPVRFTKTRAIVAVDEAADGTPVTETWEIRDLKFYKTNPRASNPIVLIRDSKPSKRKANPQAPSIKRKGARNIAYAVEAKRMLAGGGSQFEMIAGFPTKAQAQDYIDALLKSYPKGLTLRISAA